MICYHRLMGGPNQKIFLTFFVISFLFAPSSPQTADFQTAWVKTVVASDTFTGRVVGVKNLNWGLVDAGLAWWYRRYASDDRVLKRLEAGARAEKRGLWADKNPIPPWEWRKMQRGRHKR